MRKLPTSSVLINLYNGGLTQTAIAKKYGTSKAAVSTALKRAGVDTKRTCIVCGEVFIALRRTGQFCSRHCYNSHRYNEMEYLLPEPIVYAVHFPSVGMVKVGYSTWGNYVSRNKAKARDRYGATDGDGMWQFVGDHRHEAFLQASLAFRYPQPTSRGTDRRISEWFCVGEISMETLVEQFDAIMATIVTLGG